jgi:hypothetical protein
MSVARRTRRIVIAAVTGAIALLGSTAAEARFFDECAAPGDQTIHVVQNTMVRNERITLQTDGSFDECEVIVDDGVTLTLKNVRIGVVEDKSIRFDGGPTSRLFVDDSRVTACDFDVFGFAFVRVKRSYLLDPRDQSCDVKELEPDGSLEIINSHLRTNVTGGDTDIQLNSSGGYVTVIASQLDSGDDIQISSPIRTEVKLNALRAASGIEITGGQTTVIGNLLVAREGEVTVTGTPCRTGLNLPRVTCGAPPPPP